MDDSIYLVAQTFAPDGIKQMLPEEQLTPIWASIASVSRREWSDAGQQGLRPELVATTPAVNYNGEAVVQIGDGAAAVRYAVYRTYHNADTDQMELYLMREVGVNAKKDEHGRTVN